MHKREAKTQGQFEIIFVDENEVKDKQKFLQNYLLTVPFYQAVYLFENFSGTNLNDLNKCYYLFMESALKGNAYALFYIKYLRENYLTNISEELKLKSEKNIIIKYLDFWLENVPILQGVDPSDYFKTSIIKIEIIQRSKNNPLSFKRITEIFNFLNNKKDKCTAACVLLQDLIKDKYSESCKIKANDKKKAKQELLELINFKIVDLFLIAHSDLNFISKVYEYLDKIFIHLEQNNDCSKYNFNGILEGIMTRLSNKSYWKIAGAFMGNGFLYFIYASHSSENLETRIKSYFFSALSGNLNAKADLGMYFYFLTNSLTEEAKIYDILGCDKLPANMITTRSQLLGYDFLLAFAEISINSFKKIIIEDYVLPENKSNLNWRYWGKVYFFCGELIKLLNIQPNYDPRALVCYSSSAILDEPLGYYCLGLYYEDFFIRNNSQTTKQQAITNYKKSLELGYHYALNNLVIMHYFLNDYEQAAYYMQEFFDKKLDIATKNDQLPIVYANMLINGLGVAINEELAYETLINSAFKGNIFSKIEIIKDFIGYKNFSHKLEKNKLLEIAIYLYEEFKREVLFKQNKEVVFKQNYVAILIKFFASITDVNFTFIAKELIEQGLNDQNPKVILLMAEYTLYGNDILKIQENNSETIRYCNIILNMGLDDLIVKHSALNLKGIALMTEGNVERDFDLAEICLLEAHKHNIPYAAYNLGCLYLRMELLSKSYQYLTEANNETPDDPDVLCDLGMCLLKIKSEQINFIKEAFNKAIKLGNKRCFFDLTMLYLNEAFTSDNINQALLIDVFSLFEEYISSIDLMKKYSEESKNEIYLLYAIISLMLKPFLIGKIIEDLKKLENRSYKLQFALKYLENKPKGRNINELGLDLYLIMISSECRSIQELENKFNQNGLILYCNENLRKISEKIKEDMMIYYNDDLKLQQKIDRFKQRLARFINPNNPSSKVSFEELQKLSVKFFYLFPDKINKCVLNHAPGGGSGQKIMLYQTETEKAPIIFSHHPEHRKDRSKKEIADPKRRHDMRKSAKALQKI